ncbi:hypothetical protein CHU92_03640 [Flavobacterium cyanobacteriorum]|uniref:Secretion system C-terminal sorting domain-containing protein n=1 Tax=Flavobacterium cyanobacteriorum TaxID=2022802 RepID=A0A255ZNY3_9FLAO|nr:T9SS type A sorting domain-containing protein [Flavobacterium cyanobacteriorum]OYQ43166.1 hypothetical protein CHU92_03640 [Flavobacterium cyanobacteriorum]
MMKKITLLILIFLFSIGYSQVTNQGKPYSWKLNNLEQVMPVKMPSFDLKALKDEDKANEHRKDIPWRFGYEFIVDHNLANSGKWHTLPNGDRIWRIRFKSRGAKTLNFLFSDYYMPEGGKVYLYNNSRTDLLGAYDARQNNETRVLGTWLVQGDDVWIEYFEPAAKAGQGKLEIFKVIHGYRTAEDMQKSPDDDLNASGNCNYDVDCFVSGIENLKEINKKAVGLMITDNSGFCTGALINNTGNNGTPYFLTADHCYSNPAEWAFRFNWISPNPVCAGNANSITNAPNFYQTVSGAQLRARRAQSDFCLVQITANLPSSWNLVWAGWNRSTTAATSTFGIHHPAGDIMKVSRDLNPPTTATFDGVLSWRVADWDLGVTEGGSSGSPLFDQNGRIVGQLYGGLSACNGLNDNNSPDYYGRFDVSWNAGTTAASRLRDWLDPTNTNAITVDHYPTQQLLALDAKAQIVNLNLAACANTFSPVLKIINRGVQPLTSAQISYSLNGGTPAIFNWSGNLTSGNAADITLPSLTGASGANILNATIASPNGATDLNPADNTVSTTFNINVYPVANVTLNLVTDSFGNETSWTLKNESGTTLYSGGNYGNFQTINQTFVLNTAGCYTFTINDSESDGICCDFGDGSYTLSTGSNIIYQGGAFGSTESVAFRLDNAMSVDDNMLKASVKVYPNPSSGVFSITGMQSSVSYSLYNVLGQQVQSGKLETGSSTINISQSANGVYILKLTDSATGGQASFKLVKE